MEKQIMEDFLLPDLSTGGAEIYLQKIRDVVSRHCGSHIALKKVLKEYKFRIGAYSDTAYRDDPKEDWLEEWEKFYLSDHMFMEVIGVLEQFPCAEESLELILMVCEDGKVFAYEDDHLHLVANNLKELFDIGLQFPGIEQYYRGQFLENLTEDDWNKVKSSEVMREEDRKHEESLECMEMSLRLQTEDDWNKVKSSEVMREEDRKHEESLECMEMSLSLQKSNQEIWISPVLV